MHDLYSEKDLQQISDQLKRRYLLMGCALAVVLAGFIVSMIRRTEWLSVVTLSLFCSVMVFVIEMFTLPLHRYKKLVVSALRGRTHTEALEYEATEADSSVVDGVRCRGLIFLGSPDKHGTREQRFYWDEELPLPSFTRGQQVSLKYTGRNIIGYQLLG